MGTIMRPAGEHGRQAAHSGRRAPTLRGPPGSDSAVNRSLTLNRVGSPQPEGIPRSLPILVARRWGQPDADASAACAGSAAASG